MKRGTVARRKKPMQRELVLKVLIKKEAQGGYSVLCPDLGVASMGDTVPEARKNIKEAILCHLLTAKDLGKWDEVLEELGIDAKEFKRSRHIELDERATAVTVEVPA
jgi:predicted RNase H-like HicB family nuclease